MNQKLKFLLLAVGLVGLIAIAALLYNSLGEGIGTNQLTTRPLKTPPASTTPEAGASPEDTGPEETEFLAPDFTVYDVQGNPVQLSDFFGKPIVLNFWASWCGPCKGEMPHFQEKFREYEGQAQFLMVNMTDGSRETVGVAKKFLNSMGYDFPVYFDTAFSAATVYSVYSLPTTYFIDAQGNLIARATGAIDADTLQQGLDMILE